MLLLQLPKSLEGMSSEKKEVKAAIKETATALAEVTIITITIHNHHHCITVSTTSPPPQPEDHNNSQKRDSIPLGNTPPPRPCPFSHLSGEDQGRQGQRHGRHCYRQSCHGRYNLPTYLQTMKAFVAS